MSDYTFLSACKKISSLKLVQASSGNLSSRNVFDQQEFIISSSGCWFGDIQDEDVVRCSIKTKKKVEESYKIQNPSSETLMHARIYENRPDVSTILHYQPVYGTIIACMSKKIDEFRVIPEIPYYIRNITYVHYHKPGSNELAEIVAGAFKDNELVIMRNHGLTVVGSNYDQVIQRAVFFELACEIIVKSEGKVEYITEI
jgi:ribulose-5-phosphate 4-epimerase/fuculose-1-phosphate aldolase